MSEALQPGTSAISEIEQRLGRRVSELRSARGYTQDRLASETGFTKGYLSKIENSKVIPPIGTLVKIAQALHTDLADLLGAESSAERNDGICVVRSWEREPVVRGGSSFGYDYVALAHKKRHKHMDPFIMVFPSNLDKDVRFEHEGEEFLYVIEGEVEFSFITDGRERQWVLSPGDSVYFDSRIPHRGRSLKGESRALVVIFRPQDGQ
jgi:transcriptional regulator with XRE-family HTH domain